MGNGATPTPQASQTIPPSIATPAPSPTPSTLDLRWDDRDSFVWRTVPKAVTYELTGTAYAIRANAASPFCVAPLSMDAQNNTLDQTFDGSATSFHITLPSLPSEDIWFVAGAIVDLRAVDANGTTVASDHVGFLYETFCGTPSTPVPRLRAPDAGTGRSSVGSAGHLVIALAACGLALVAAGLRRSRLRN